MIIGLTGGIASGKSTVSKYFKELGLEIVDADLVAKEISNRKETIDKMVEVFGEDILDENGNLIREKIRELVFNNKEFLEKLNSIIHPKVMEYFKMKREENRGKKILIFDIPLLYETKMEKFCDKVIVVGLSKDKQIERVMERDKNSRELAEKIIKTQMSLEEKLKRADIVILNDGSLDDLKKRVEDVYKNFFSER